jgi:PHP family Zn ribbon phosphoesterase
MSSSDPHSPDVWRLGRECNAFELSSTPTYNEIWNQVHNKQMLYTVEVAPEYGKYHNDGCSQHGINWSPTEALAHKNRCTGPDGRMPPHELNLGVAHRIEQIADRPEGYRPSTYVPFKTYIPLYEIISFAMGRGTLNNKTTAKEQDQILSKLGTELHVLENADVTELSRVCSQTIVDAIMSVRNGTVKYRPGADGEYGIPHFMKPQASVEKWST